MQNCLNSNTKALQIVFEKTELDNPKVDGIIVSKGKLERNLLHKQYNQNQ